MDVWDSYQSFLSAVGVIESRNLVAALLVAPAGNLGGEQAALDAYNGYLQQMPTFPDRHVVAAALTLAEGLSQIGTTAPPIASTDLSDVAYGPWTPALQFGGNVTGITYSSNTGYHRTIAKFVVIEFAFALTSKGTATGPATLGNLPYPVGDGFQGFWPFMDLGGLASAGGSILGGGFLSGDAPNTIRFALNNIANNPNQNQITQMTDADFTNTTAIQGSFVYLIA